MKYTCIFLFLLYYTSVEAQDSIRSLPAKRTNQSVKIDGFLNDPAWLNASPVRDFVQQRPNYNQPEHVSSRTEALLMYDDEAVYFGGFNHENRKDSISTELVGRDGIGINDFIGIIFDTYKDEINGTGFYVTALGEQF